MLNASQVVFEVNPFLQSPIRNFVNRLARHCPTNQVVTVDCHWLGSNGAVSAVSQALAQNNVTERPVFRLNDSPAVFREVQQAAALHGEGACLRLGSGRDDPDPNVPVQAVLTAIGNLGLAISDIDLLIDFKTVSSSRDVGRCVPLALAVLGWAHSCGNWRSVTLVSGAFPESISHLPVGTTSPVARHDAILFASVLQNNPVIVPDFGDYGITYPILAQTPPRSPNPNLKYTDGLQWQIDREPRRLLGNNSFRTICRRLVRAPYWQGASYSEGDRMLDECARRASGPGNATSWLQFGQSHHFAHVVDRLATQGVP